MFHFPLFRVPDYFQGNLQAQLKTPERQELTNAIIRFAGDSGDGIQLTGSMFTHESAVLGHDVSTLPDFPAEIRAPTGTRAGVSSFQLNFSSGEIHTPGDRPHALVALNPAALVVHLAGPHLGRHPHPG